MTLTTWRRSRTTLGDVAAGLSRKWGWDVLPGTRLVRVGREARCSCRRSGCAEPGRHPARPDWAALPAAAPRLAVEEWWSRFPDAPVLLATGRAFDVIDVPVVGGMRALHRLERMGARLGPVARTPADRLLFWVAPGAAEAVPALLNRLGWDDATELDLRCHGEGGYVPAPPSRIGGAAAEWIRAPESPCHLPEARVLLGTISCACHTHGCRSASLP